MDLKTLKTFQTIVTTGSFNKAAEVMNYAQSTVTMQIQRLESELGVQLMERGKRIRLTEAGRIFYQQSLPILKDLEQLQATLIDMQWGETGHIRLGVIEPAASFRIPGILQSFLQELPNIRMSVHIANTPALCEQVQRGDLDMAICSPPELDSELYFEPLFKEEFAVLLPEQHPLTLQNAVSPEQLREHRLLITADHCPYRRKLELLLQESGRTPMDTMEISSMSALKYYVEKGLGIALIPKIALTPVPSGTVTRPLLGRSIDMTCGIVYKASEHPLKQAYARLQMHLKRQFPATIINYPTK